LGKDVDTRFCRGYKRFLSDAIIFSARDALLARGRDSSRRCLRNRNDRARAAGKQSMSEGKILAWMRE
jgi:hypothetical protein